MPELAATTDKSELKNSGWKSATVGKLLLVLFTALVTFLITHYSGIYNGRTRVLQYLASATSGVITKPDLVGKDLKILIDGKQIDNVSSTTFALFNTTDQDYEDVILGLTFGPVDGKPPILVQANVHTTPQAYDLMPIPSIILNDGTLRFQYKIHVVNRTDTNAFQSSFLFEGGKTPPLTVYLEKKGLTAVEIDPTKLHQETQPIAEVFFATFGSVCASVTFWFLFKTRMTLRFAKDEIAGLRRRTLRQEKKLAD